MRLNTYLESPLLVLRDVVALFSLNPACQEAIVRKRHRAAIEYDDIMSRVFHHARGLILNIIADFAIPY